MLLLVCLHVPTELVHEVHLNKAEDRSEQDQAEGLLRGSEVLFAANELGVLRGLVASDSRDEHHHPLEERKEVEAIEVVHHLGCGGRTVMVTLFVAVVVALVVTVMVFTVVVFAVVVTSVFEIVVTVLSFVVAPLEFAAFTELSRLFIVPTVSPFVVFENVLPVTLAFLLLLNVGVSSVLSFEDTVPEVVAGYFTGRPLARRAVRLRRAMRTRWSHVLGRRSKHEWHDCGTDTNNRDHGNNRRAPLELPLPLGELFVLLGEFTDHHIVVHLLFNRHFGCGMLASRGASVHLVKRRRLNVGITRFHPVLI